MPKPVHSIFTLVSVAVLALTAGCRQEKPESESIPDEPTASSPGQKTSPDPVANPVPKPLVTEGALKIHPIGDKSAWDGASIRDVQAVLESAGTELIRWFPARHLEPIQVEPKGGPITLYNRDSGGGYTVKLNTGKTFWAQYSFQFSHELCHILSNYRKDENPNGWFEESLCEVASLFTLKQMAETWKTDPPYENWKSFHSALVDYAQKRIDESALQARKPLPEWFEEMEPKLRESAGQRELNNVVAVHLLPLFEANPKGWEAIGWLNVDQSYPDDTFPEFLERWHYYCPDRHRPFVQKIAAKFAIQIGEAP
ncbi:MAG: hypothetical protein HKN23_01140 [Verrucomicrobiales bacterium]|nr:hypothetical protein [Verrucomicrobiales bacterium]